MNENPDAMPVSEPGRADVPPPDVPLTSSAQRYLDQTRPWARFLSIMTFLMAAFMTLAGITMIVLGIGPRFVPSGPGRFGSLGSVEGATGGLFYIVLAILYLAPGVFLSRYASAIRVLEMTRSPQALEDALRNQKSFWRYIGILTIIGLIFTAAVIAVGLILLVLFTRR